MIRLLFALIANLLSLPWAPVRWWRRRNAAGPDGWIHLVIDGPVVDLAQRPGALGELLSELLASGTGGGGRLHREVGLHRLRLALDELAADPKARGLVVTLRSVSGGQARLRSLRERLRALREAGKPVVVFLPEGAGMAELAVASAASQVWLEPGAHIAPLGVSVAMPYWGEALRRVGVGAEVLTRGEFKTAAESFVADRMSERQREQLGALVGDLFDDLVEGVARGRSVAREQVEAWVEQSPLAAPDAHALGLVDALVTEEDRERWLATFPAPFQSSASAPHEPLGQVTTVGIGTYLKRRRARRIALRRAPYVAVVDVHGAIVGEAARGAAAADALVPLLRRVGDERAARAVVLHIDSRGGSALASLRIYRAVRQIAKKKPVIAYFSDVAASGGYMIGCGARRIIAQPVTLTGSVGVVAAKPVVSELLERLGIRLETVKRGERADMYSPARRLTEGERGAFERELDVTYDQFLQLVAEARGMTLEQVRPVAGGRVWSGKAAAEVGLVDELGSFETALEHARAELGASGTALEPRRCGVPGLRAVPLRFPRLGLGTAGELLAAAGGAGANGAVGRATQAMVGVTAQSVLGEWLALLASGRAGHHKPSERILAYCGVLHEREGHVAIDAAPDAMPLR